METPLSIHRPQSGPGSIQIPEISFCGDYATLFAQFSSPLGGPFHFVATTDVMTWGPYSIPPTTVQGVTFEWVGGTLGFVSRVSQFVVQ